jgi:hypothetical protein
MATMQIARPLLLISTPVGVVIGVHEAFRLAGGLAFLLIAMLGLLSAAIGSVVVMIRREQRADGERV